MSTYIPESVLDNIENLKKDGKFDEAMKIINSLLSKNPSNEDALLQVADIQYRQGEIGKASKAIDFLNSRKNNEDPLGLYIKGILEMEKNNRLEAKKYLQRALVLTEAKNHEIVRCYGLCEYWYGNREKGIDLLKDSFSLNNKDAEVIFNLIEIYILEHKYIKARNMIKYYYKNHKDLITVDKEINHYDNKINLFEEFIKTQLIFK
ncbi:MAG TPA: tetratricopeptide repeat protein [Candidatus Absconditabacterales bacterium]|nr:tetratricopeptide repeat protein [Candidatus Absconditabacterales bacterium]